MEVSPWALAESSSAVEDGAVALALAVEATLVVSVVVALAVAVQAGVGNTIYF